MLKMAHKRLFVLLALLSTGAHAQWLNFPTPGTPRTRDGKPNLAAPAPRALDGKPDPSGVWMHEPTTVAEVKRQFGADPANVCMDVVGIPLAGLVSEPIKIVQAPRLTMILYEVDNLHRQIFTDGRKLPKEFYLPAYLGYSAGHWEGDTLVVETAGFNDKTVLDGMGHPHSDALRMVERYRRRDFGHLDVEMTFDDPKMYTKPFTIKVPHELLPEDDIFEMYCENEKDSIHLGKR